MIHLPDELILHIISCKHPCSSRASPGGWGRQRGGGGAVVEVNSMLIFFLSL